MSPYAMLAVAGRAVEVDAGMIRSFRRHRLVAASMLLALATLSALSAVPSNASTPKPVRPATVEATPAHTSSIVVRARSGGDLPRVEAAVRDAGYSVAERIPSMKALAVGLPPGVGAVEAVTRLTGAPGVLYAEPAYPVRAADVPADALFERQQPYLSAVRAPEAWEVETGNPGIVVAVLDTGVDITHPDLAGRIWSNPNDAVANGIDDDTNGCIDDAHGCAVVLTSDGECAIAIDGNIADDAGHGTFVAGIIAANADGHGIVGVARGATIMPVKVLDCQGRGTSVELAQGIVYAAENGARVINISLGGNVDSFFVQEALRIAHDDYGVVIVAASGNSGEAGVTYPARYPNVIAVGAASAGDPGKRATFSAYGPEVDVVAVGEGVIGTMAAAFCDEFLRCLNEDGYAEADGTSFSAPQVSGLVALILSRRPLTTPDGMLLILKATADKVPPGGQPDWAGAGRINMLNALVPQFRLGAPGVTRN